MSTEPSIFTRILRGDIPSEMVGETENVFAIKDIAPRAPLHLLVIPKTEKYRNVVEFDTSNFLRLNLQERVNIVTQLQPLGVITDEQAQSLLAFNPSNTAGGIA